MRIVQGWVSALAFAYAGCVGEPLDAASGPEPITLSFRAEQVQTGTEDYLCFGFPADHLAGQAVERIAWFPPDGGGVALHHATAYAVPEPFPDGPLSCAWMPASAVGLHIGGGASWEVAAGLGPLALMERRWRSGPW